jgi:hypothetical protein
LHGKFPSIVSQLTKLAIYGAESGGEPFGISLEKAWYVRGYFAIGVFAALVILDLIETLLKVTDEM